MTDQVSVEVIPPKGTSASANGYTPSFTKSTIVTHTWVGRFLGPITPSTGYQPYRDTSSRARVVAIAMAQEANTSAIPIAYAGGDPMQGQGLAHPVANPNAIPIANAGGDPMQRQEFAYQVAQYDTSGPASSESYGPIRSRSPTLDRRPQMGNVPLTDQDVGMSPPSETRGATLRSRAGKFGKTIHQIPPWNSDAKPS